MRGHMTLLLLIPALGLRAAPRSAPRLTAPRAAAKPGREITPPPDELRNRYFAVRHGQSTANLENIISSDPYIGSTRHELTQLGKEQASEAGASLWAMLEEDGTPLEEVALYSSNFTRARETKEIVAFELQRAWARSNGGVLSGDATGGGGGGESPMVRIGLLSGLRERNFGALDGVNTGAYDDVWPRDLVDPFHEENGVESVASVCARLRAMVDTLEARHNGEAVVLCAHADVIQIFQCWMACDANVCEFSSYRYKNGEVRRCDEVGECLPEPMPMVSQRGTAA